MAHLKSKTQLKEEGMIIFFGKEVHMESILETVKRSVNIDPTDDSFDAEILLSINMSIFKLKQLGITVDSSTEIKDNTSTWMETFGDNVNEIAAIKNYMRINARLEFDPPTSSFAITALNEQKLELEWRLNLQVEGGND